MAHAVFITLHALAGLIAFGSGVVALRQGRWFYLYLSSLAGMAAFLLLAVAVTWAELGAEERLLFAAFVVLAWVMVGLAVGARRLRPEGSARPGSTYLDRVGFTLVALFDAFTVIVVLDVGGQVWLVVASGVVIAVAGHFVLRSTKRTLTSGARPRAHGQVN
ncbi:hypothetical protein EV644_13910 [Kribbella orskensis]|uniref:Membrane protein DUF2306 n=1 Tax=Kribbella orskensis TaxID=2512216 RepID=A0ABY2B723_9ACTN|nr:MULTISPECIES: hypothetical protein [Kribbella]TCN29272.1 hypothetical protein EV642_14239 [Kribbella sp. VKM Ac-2500]TCO09543.1 hypothetical protein EV644_13910 [Kribbella orskensis]